MEGMYSEDKSGTGGHLTYNTIISFCSGDGRGWRKARWNDGVRGEGRHTFILFRFDKAGKLLRGTHF